MLTHHHTKTTDTDSRAWPAIYGFPTKEGGTGNFEKDPQWWNKTVSGVVNILDADDAGHRRMRRLQNPAFSDKALRAQESVICGYASLLVHKLHGLCSGGDGGGGGAVVDMTAWYNFTTFGMLLFSRSLYFCLMRPFCPYRQGLYSGGWTGCMRPRANDLPRLTHLFITHTHTHTHRH